MIGIMKILHRVIFLAAVFFCAPSASHAQSRTAVTIYGLKGASGVALLRLFEAPPQMPSYALTVQALPQADIMAALFISGEAKIGILPPNMAAKIAASGGKLQIAAVTGTGMLSLLSGDPSVRRIEDLKGKTVEVAGQGATPDFVFRKIVRSKGMVIGRDIHFGYALAYPEMARALAADRIRYALLPEPFATMALNANSSLKAVGDIQGDWARLTGDNAPYAGQAGNFPMSALVVDRDFASAHGALIALILENIQNSIEWVTTHPAEAGLLAEKHELGLPARVVQDAIPKSNYVFIPAVRARAALEALFAVFLEFAPESIGGRMPADDFYFDSQSVSVHTWILTTEGTEFQGGNYGIHFKNSVFLRVLRGLFINNTMYNDVNLPKNRYCEKYALTMGSQWNR
jgi:NitT/TauT family transport system substrate-binding protein